MHKHRGTERQRLTKSQRLTEVDEQNDRGQRDRDTQSGTDMAKPSLQTVTFVPPSAPPPAPPRLAIGTRPRYSQPPHCQASARSALGSVGPGIAMPSAPSTLGAVDPRLGRPRASHALGAVDPRLVTRLNRVAKLESCMHSVAMVTHSEFFKG